MFSREFTRTIRIRVGSLLSWPVPPLEWTGHTDYVYSVSYSPNGTRVVSGSNDNMIRIWDAESGAVVGEPLKGHNGGVNSVAYSPDGRYIISGSYDRTIRIWDAETGAAVGNPLEVHTDSVSSIAYSPDGRHIISGSADRTIRIWNAETGSEPSETLMGHASLVRSIAYSSHRQHIVFGSSDNIPRKWDIFPHVSIQPSSCNPIRTFFCAKPDLGGWVRDSEGGLLYWVPHDCRESVHSLALLTMPLSARNRSVSLDFDHFAFGTSWTQIFKSTTS